MNVRNQQTLGRIVLLGGKNLESEEQSEKCAKQNAKNHPTASIFLTCLAGILRANQGAHPSRVCRTEEFETMLGGTLRQLPDEDAPQ